MRKEIKRTCFHCGKSFICYGECNENALLEEKKNCICRKCGERDGAGKGYNYDTYGCQRGNGREKVEFT